MFEWLKFKFAMIFGKPYFGPIMTAKMGRVIRHGYMQKLLELECVRLKSFALSSAQDNFEYRVLEIGSWAGGSTITFAGAIKKHNGGKGKVVAVDAWQSFHGNEHVEKPSHVVMEKALKEGKIFNLFLHNIKSAGVADLVEVKRGWSRDVLTTLPMKYFDLIFIDGSHFYKDVLEDLRNSALLLKDGGVICGDDLELQFNEVDKSILMENKDNDTLRDPVFKKDYHPGVTLAVQEFFLQSVSVWKGFWAVRKIGSSHASNGADYAWEKISYKEMDDGRVEIPKHLK